MSKSRNTNLVLIMNKIGRYGNMAMAFKIIGGTLMGLAFLVIIGTAGSDCDGDCMEKALPIGQMLIQFGIALFAGYLGYQMYMYGEERDNV